MKRQFSKKDLQQFASMGLTEEDVDKQIENFKKGFPKTVLHDAATVENGGIIRLDDKEIAHYTDIYKKLSKGRTIMKFVPASGAATRMFKDLYAFTSTYFGVAHNFEKEFPTVKEFLQHIRSFAFFEELKECMEKSHLDFGDYMDRGDFTTVINYLLKEQYMGYGSLPKALLKFHRYGNTPRTPLEEHIVEGAEYARNSNGTVNIHFTVSPEHRQLFRAKIAEVKEYYENKFDIKLNITLSEQKHYTDTIAVDEYNNPVRDEKGNLSFRPGGHGALIENLHECKADVIFIKNIDNVVPDWMKHTTIVYKQALAGMMLELQNKMFEYIDVLKQEPNERKMIEITKFVEERLKYPLSHGWDSVRQWEESLRKALYRPIRICGMVRNQGEPGGGPFYAKSTKRADSLQIVETAQINRKDPSQEAILNSATHFNPVDLVCGIKDYRGNRYNLSRYIDPATGFISKKTKGALTVKSQELPGLWNGAMSEWITLFVEVPLATFNPVKTVNDLLRKEHLEG
ncbi:MAG: DUF4301 family protein [Bacteroidales bacterium]|nr:DUF4301 family protein [Bacteroidales bacterium]